MHVVELCRACRHERASHRAEDGRCMESMEMLEGDDGMDVAVPCECPGWLQSNGPRGTSAPAVSR